MKASGEHQQQWIIGKQTKRLIELIDVHLEIAQQHAGRGAIPVEHGTVTRWLRHHHVEQPARKLPVIRSVVQTELAAIVEPDQTLPACRGTARHRVGPLGTSERRRRVQGRAAFQQTVLQREDPRVFAGRWCGLRNATAHGARHAAKPIQLGPGVHHASPSAVPAAAFDPDAEPVAAWVIHQLQQRRQVDRELLQILGRPAFQLTRAAVGYSRLMRRNDPSARGGSRLHRAGSGRAGH